MGFNHRKALSALLSLVLLLPVQITAVSAEEEPQAAEETQQSYEENQSEITAAENQGSETADPQPAQEVQEMDAQAPETEDLPAAESSAAETAEADISEAEASENEVQEESVQSEMTAQEEGNETEPSVLYQVHLSNIGWTRNYQNGETTDEGRIEAFRISSDVLNGEIIYQSHVAHIGWMNEVPSGSISGTTGLSRQVEAVRIRLSGPDSEKYNIAYRVKIDGYGWTDWALNGAECGSEGYSRALQSMEIRLVQKGSVVPDPEKSFFKNPAVKIEAHVQNKGWLSSVNNGEPAGTTGQSLRMEALKINLPDDLAQLGDIEAYAHVSNIGWMDPVSSSAIIGTTGRSQSIEAVRIALTGQLAENSTISVIAPMSATSAGLIMHTMAKQPVLSVMAWQ